MIETAVNRCMNKWPDGLYEQFRGQLDQLTDPVVQHELLVTICEYVRPWRKGPFTIGSLTINAEWDCRFKTARLQKALKNHPIKRVLDVGGNNGYFCHELISMGAKKAVCVDPTSFYRMQFELIQKFNPQPNIQFITAGIEDIHYLTTSFDTVLCMGVLYHHPSPDQCLKWLKRVMTNHGVLVLETLIIDGDDPVAIVPHSTYAGMKHIYYIPTKSAIENVIRRAGFRRIEWMGKADIAEHEQRPTKWSYNHSYQSHMNRGDRCTMEGYPTASRYMINVYK